MEKFKIYGYKDFVQSAYFDTLEELEIYINRINKFGGMKYTIEYLGTFQGREDVIKIIDENGQEKIEVAIDEDGYAIYNERRNTWDFNYGSLREYYDALKQRGLILTEDIYGKIDAYYKGTVHKLSQKI